METLVLNVIRILNKEKKSKLKYLGLDFFIFKVYKTIDTCELCGEFFKIQEKTKANTYKSQKLIFAMS